MYIYYSLNKLVLRAVYKVSDTLVDEKFSPCELSDFWKLF